MSCNNCNAILNQATSSGDQCISCGQICCNRCLKICVECDELVCKKCSRKCIGQCECIYCKDCYSTMSFSNSSLYLAGLLLILTIACLLTNPKSYLREVLSMISIMVFILNFLVIEVDNENSRTDRREVDNEHNDDQIDELKHLHLVKCLVP